MTNKEAATILINYFKPPIIRNDGKSMAHLLALEAIGKAVDALEVADVVRVPIKGYEGSYEVDQFGRVFALDRTVRVDDNGRVYDKPIKARQLKQGVHSKGYKIVTLTKDGVSKTAFVHRLVAEAFIPNENNLPCINHKDEDKTNNFVENLEWCTVQYNSTYGKAKQKQAAKLIGRPLTEEHKQKIAEGVKRFYRSKGERKESEE